ncbi:hypothetical protein ABH944_006308 [Caballeronia udeis]|uniref:TauD/TfdA-like domain-containing protein n=1 Tax=Caballeronia udeis TaxID=1232866 RepID=A0ABW8MRQ5_9BURK
MTTLVRNESAWKGASYRNRTDWIVEFTKEDLSELDAALSVVQCEGLALADIGTLAFPLPTLREKLAAYIEEVRVGRGFLVLRGIPVEQYTNEEVGVIFWGLGAYLGVPVMQTPKGDLLGHVKNYGRTPGQLDVRGYETNAHLHFHTDSADVIGLMCLRKAKSGGMSSIVSSMSIYNTIVENRPEYLPILRRGFQYIRREAAFSDAPVSPHRLPIFGEADGIVSCRYLRTQIEAACVRMEKPLTPEETEVLDYFDSIAVHPDYRLDMSLEVGDIQLINNYTTLHSRTAFEDYDEPDRKRHMLRLWLMLRERRPLPPEFPPHSGYGPGQNVEVALADSNEMPRHTA